MPHEPHLAPNTANFRPLTPLDFLERAELAWPRRQAVIWRNVTLDWVDFGQLVRRMAHWLAEQGIGPGDVVSLIATNRPEMLAAHYAVPALGAILHSVNIRLDAGAVRWILEHSGSRLVLADPGCAAVAHEAAGAVPMHVFADDGRSGEGLALLAPGDAPGLDLTARVADEWQPIALNYTSGTTGDPKGAVLHHRGAWLNAMGNVMALGLDSDSRYLWTLPMFHCNGWCHTWAVTAAGGVHVCLDRVVPAAIFDSITRYNVTHMSCAPVVLYMMLNDPSRKGYLPRHQVRVATGGAAPTSALIRQMEDLGFDFLHLYGLTECFGPVSLRRIEAEENALPLEDRATLLSRQGLRHATAARMRVIDDQGGDVPRDGATMGEIALSGNTVFAGYLHDPEATGRAFADGMFRTGDLAVMHPDGHVEISDRSKDVIITGGENVSSLEIEAALHLHPDVMLAAVVAKPDPKWGEVPMAFVELKPGAQPDPKALELFSREHLAGFKIPRDWLFQPLPRTATGKIQKYQLREIAREQGK